MSACMTPEQLEQFLRDELDGLERDTILAHLEECAACQQVLEQITTGAETGGGSPSGPKDDDRVALLIERVKVKGPVRLDEDQPTIDRLDPDGLNPRPGGSPLGVRPVDRSATTTPSLPAIAGFRIIREIGRGGMGVVYEAEEEVLSRRVALKVLPVSVLDHHRQVERFDREAKAAARLHHTNIVPVFGVGHQDGQHYYVMQYIEGQGLDAVRDELRRHRAAAPAARQSTLSGPVDRVAPGATARNAAADAARSLVIGSFVAAEHLSSDPTTALGVSGETVIQSPRAVRLSPEPADPSPFLLPSSSGLLSHLELSRPYFQGLARIGLQVAEALEYANRQGVLHRDVKPSNLLLDRQGNTWLTDFGLAKTAEADDLTATGETLGTIRYMAPERFQGVCDARSDLYALGLTLYELVALRPPYEESDRFQLIERIRHSEPPRLKTLEPKVPRDLETIIHKAVMREPSRRYATAGAMAEDLRRFLEGRPIQARQASRAERLVRWFRRNPWVTAFLVALVLGLIASAWQAVRATRAEAATRKERDRAEQETAKTKKSESEARAVLDFFQNKIMAAARPEGQEGGLGKDVKLRAAVDAAERGIGPSFADQPAVEASIRDTLGQTYYYLGEPALAIHQYQQALATRRQVLGPDHPDTLGSMNNLGMAYLDTGRLADAIPLVEEAMKRCQAELGPDDPLTLVSMGNLAHAYGAASRLADALPIHEETLKRLEAKFGPDHMHTLTELNNLANVYRSAGRNAQALPLFEQTLERLRRTVGPSHPYTLLSMINLALAYGDAGRLADAIPLHEEAMKLSETQLGPDHTDTLFSRDALAMAYEQARRFAEAVPLRQETLKRRRAKLGPDDPGTLASMNNLARVYLDVKPTEAEPLLRQSLAIHNQKTPDDWSTFETRSLLGASLLGQKKYAEAESLLIQGYEGLAARAAKISAGSQKLVPEALGRIVQLYHDWGKKDQAQEWRKKLHSPLGPTRKE
jgi:eukaryotic-like serine/threonine-protein kinase